MMRILCRIFSFLFFSGIQLVSADTPALQAHKTDSPLKIDGRLDEQVWSKAAIAGNFKQKDPQNGGRIYQNTEVKILYDDFALYIGATLYDTRPDSILKQLGIRDEDGLNAEFFMVGFDTYLTKQDAYYFGVYSSGVQMDFKEQDATFDAVWESSVNINEKGWTVEMRIPYYALRFPDKPEQLWGLNFLRNIRRKREADEWALTPQTAGKPLNYWGTLTGINNIKPPVRLSLTPYLSAAAQHFPYNTPGIDNTRFDYSIGADIKYGINERFTLDMTLLPDFAQVQSDNLVKNISPFEVVFNENRPFFKEGVELFQKGDLFYSRRIGKTPARYYDVSFNTDTAQYRLIDNPSKVRLLNATKVSGRTGGGLGIGVFNAVTANTYATLENKVTGERSRQPTEPLANYNIVVFDQQLKYNSGAYFINTNVSRPGSSYLNGNVTGAGLRLDDPENRYEVNGEMAVSKRYNELNPLTNGMKAGYKYNLSLAKISGNFLFTLNRNSLDNRFNSNDMGLLLFNDNIVNQLVLQYNIYKPFGSYFKSYNTLQINYDKNYTSGLRTRTVLNYNTFMLTKTYFGYFFGGEVAPIKSRDFYEPRVPGRFFLSPEYYIGFVGISTDYRKALALDVTINAGVIPYNKGEYYHYEIAPLVRVSDRFTFRHAFSYELQPRNLGFATFDTANRIIFSERDIKTLSNTFTGKYLFTPNMNLSIKLRHYWSSGVYHNFAYLQEDGTLKNVDAPGAPPSAPLRDNFNSNFFNVDLIYDWRFAPGSNLTLVYKNAIQGEKTVVNNNYFSNVDDVLRESILNSFSVKVLYFLDYNYLARRKKQS